jgi:hypothetical protein
LKKVESRIIKSLFDWTIIAPPLLYDSISVNSEFVTVHSLANMYSAPGDPPLLRLENLLLWIVPKEPEFR